MTTPARQPNTQSPAINLCGRGIWFVLVLLAALALLVAPSGNHAAAGATNKALALGPEPNLLQPGQSAPNLNQLIDALQKRYSKMSAIGADFTQIYMGPDGQTLREGGHVILKRPRKARWDYTHPERKIFISDGKNIFFYVYGDREATRTSIRESVDPQVPFLFLLGQGNLRRDFIRIEIDTNQQPVVAGDLVLKLFPKRAPEDFKQLLAEVNPATAEVRRLVILQRNGTAMDFYLSNVVNNLTVSDSEFAFTPPPGVIVRHETQ
jgi:outer membrane lipoprotein carrier protein